MQDDYDPFEVFDQAMGAGQVRTPYPGYADMRRKGWKLLQVSANKSEMLAVFGRTKPELLNRQEAPT